MESASWTCSICRTADQPASGRVAGEFSAIAGGREFRHPAYRVCQCSGCGAYQKTARLSDPELSVYYDHLEFESYDVDRLLPPDRLIVAAANALPPSSRILDYGCGVGRSLALSVGRHACFGVEPNERAASMAAARGITVINDAELEERLAGSVDLVVLSDVYEHLTRPLDVVLRLSRCLKPGGSLVIVTGFADTVRPQELIPEFWYFRILGHLHMATERHLRWLASEADLTLESHRVLCHYEPDFFHDIGQRIRLWAYATTHLAPSGMAARLIARVPVLGRAARWSNAPMVSCGDDHVFVSFRKTEGKRL